MLKSLLSIREETQASMFLVLFVTGLFLNFWSSHSADLMASWVAGHFLHAGVPDAVYVGGNRPFDLLPHPEWVPLLETEGYLGPVYPFIYPPLWAWLMGHLPTLQDFWVFMVIMTLVNAAMMAMIIQFAWRAARPETKPSVWILTCIIALTMTSIGMVAMMQNQPHILVTLLLVLTIERSRAGAQTTAGVALALAASLKLLPALFVFAFLVLGQYRAFASFVISGAALAAASVAVAGWPLHEAFLAEVRGVSDTILVTAMSFNIHSSIAQLFFADGLVEVDPAVITNYEGEVGSFFYIEAGQLAVLASRACLLLSVLWCLWLLRRSDEQTRYGIVWPLMITLTAVTSPLSWAYYFITAVAFLPVLYDRLGFREGRLAIVLIILPISHPLTGIYLDSELVADAYQVVGTASMVGLTIAFVAALRPAARPASAIGDRGARETAAQTPQIRVAAE